MALDPGEKKTIWIGAAWRSVLVRRSRRTRRLLVRADVWRGIEVVLPLRLVWRAAEQFLQERGEWIARQEMRLKTLREKVPRYRWETGEMIQEAGKPLRLKVTVDPQRKNICAAERDGELHIRVPARELARAAAARWFRRRARIFFRGAAAELLAAEGVGAPAVRIGDQRWQWGSCTARGQLSFNWRLMLAPTEVARYVAVHEVAHLKVRNHSPAFWAEVQKMDPEWEEHRRWLKRYGYCLVLLSAEEKENRLL